MEYDDEKLPSLEVMPELAKAYSNSLKEQGFVFIKLSNEEYSFLIDEVFDTLFKLRSSYKFLNNFMESKKLYNLNEEQIDILRDLFSYKTNRAFQVKTNRTKCFINTFSLEFKLVLKLNELAYKSEKIEEISKILNKRLQILAENYEIYGIFNNLKSLSFD